MLLEAVAVVAALFSEYGLNEGVVIEEAFTEEADGHVDVDPSCPVKVSTDPDADDSEEIDDMREAISRIGEKFDVSSLLVRSVVVTKSEHEHWADAWQAHFSLLRLGRRTVVRAPWHDYDPAPDEILIEIEVLGMAFGAGGHPSTHQVMTALEEELAPEPGVIDVGTGTGILAIVGARLGAESVDAVDIEPVVVQVARGNVVRTALWASSASSWAVSAWASHFRRSTM